MPIQVAVYLANLLYPVKRIAKFPPLTMQSKEQARQLETNHSDLGLGPQFVRKEKFPSFCEHRHKTKTVGQGDSYLLCDCVTVCLAVFLRNFCLCLLLLMSKSDPRLSLGISSVSET